MSTACPLDAAVSRPASACVASGYRSGGRYEHYRRRRCAGVVPDLVRALQGLRPDLLVYEASDLAAVIAGAELGLPVVCLGIWAVGRWHVPHGELVARMAPLWAERTGAGALPLPSLYGATYLDPCPFGRHGARVAVDERSRRLPMRLPPWGDPSMELPAWIHSRGSRPLVYLTLGTVGWGSADVVRGAIEGLAPLPVDVVVALGAHFDPAAGLVLSREAVEPEAVSQAVQALLEEASYAGAAQRLKAEIATMPAPADRVADLVAAAGGAG